MYRNRVSEKIKRIIKFSKEKTSLDINYILKGGFWIVIQRSFGIISALVLGYLFANYLSTELYGTYKYLLSTMELLGALSLSSGLLFVTTKVFADGVSTISIHDIAKKIYTSHIPFFVLTFAISGYYFYKGNIFLSGSFLVVLLLFPVFQAMSVYRSANEGKKLFKKTTEFDLQISVGNLLAVSLTLLLQAHVFVIFLANLASKTLMNALNYVHFAKTYKHYSKKLKKKDVKTATHISVMNLFGTIGSQIDKLLIFQLLGPRELAVYSFATIVPAQIESFVKQGQALSLQKLSGKSSDYVNKSIVKKMFQSLPVLIVLYAGYYMISPYIFSYIFPQYMDSIAYSQLYALVFFTYFDISPFAFIANNNMKGKYIQTFVKTFGRILLFAILIPLYGTTGAIISILGSNFASSITGTAIAWIGLKHAAKG